MDETPVQARPCADSLSAGTGSPTYLIEECTVRVGTKKRRHVSDDVVTAALGQTSAGVKEHHMCKMAGV